MKLAVLEVSKSGPSDYHDKLFSGRDNVDFFYVTFGKKDTSENCLGFYPKTHWAQTRNFLYKNVPKCYDYYMFIDEDINLDSALGDPIDVLIEDLKKYKPVVLSPLYVVNNFPEFTGTKENTLYQRLFSNNCVKIIHKNFLDWLLPYNNIFGGSWSACHFINFLEIPLFESILTTTKVTMRNLNSSGHDIVSDNSHALNMEKVWNWFKPCFLSICKEGDNSLYIKKYYQAQTIPAKPRSDFLKLNDIKINKYFDTSHEFFKLQRQNILNELQ